MEKKKKVKLDLQKNVLKQIRQALGLTQLELANLLGVSRRSISRWELGERELQLSLPQIKALHFLLAELGLTFGDLPDSLL